MPLAITHIPFSFSSEAWKTLIFLAYSKHLIQIKSDNMWSSMTSFYCIASFTKCIPDISELPLYGQIIFHWMNILHFIYLFVHWCILGLFPLWGYYIINVQSWTFMGQFLHEHVFISFGHIPWMGFKDRVTWSAECWTLLQLGNTLSSHFSFSIPFACSVH